MSGNFKKDLKAYFKHWRILFIVTAVFLILFLIVYGVKKQAREKEVNSYHISTNTERVHGDRRVFDFADQLTDEEETKLEAYIHEKESYTMTDIVIVTLNKSLADYAPEYRDNYTMKITPDKYVMVYADKFWEDNRFGYDAPQVLDGTIGTGDGVLLVDNLCREPETNKIYTWMCTTGIVEEKFSSSMIDSVLDSFYNEVDSNYYEACIDFVDTYVFFLDPVTKVPRLGHILPYIIAVAILVIYVLANRKERLGYDTTDYDTYVVSNSIEFTENKDVFLRKSVSKTYNPPTSSSSSGGGGHHSSGGGGSHGGGGHSR